MTTNGQARNAYPAMRIFVFGVEVTDDVISCTTEYHTGSAPNTAEFVLVSPFDRYIITDPDIFALYDDVKLGDLEQDFIAIPAGASASDIETELAAKIDVIDQALRERVTRDIKDTLKASVLKAKITERVHNVVQPDVRTTGFKASAISAQEFAALRGDAVRYPFQVGDCIFHSNDPVRIFWRDPFQPDRWYFMFTGFITDYTDRVNLENGAPSQLVTIRCEDPTRLLKYARFTTNPDFIDIKALETNQDVVVRTVFNDSFTGLTLEEFMRTIIFGSVAAKTQDKFNTHDNQTFPGVRNFTNRRVSVNGAIDDAGRLDGAGTFDVDHSLTLVLKGGFEDLNPKNRSFPITDLGFYQAIIDHQVFEDDLDNLICPGHESAIPALKENLIQRNGRIIVDEVIKTIGENPHLYPCDTGRLIILLPAKLGPDVSRLLLTRDLVSFNMTHTTWRTRLALIYDVLNRVEFSFYASPKGDLLCEMPLYDFDPVDFGDSNISLQGATSFILAASDDRGPYADQFKVGRENTIGWERSFQDEHVRTQMSCEWQLLKGRTGTPSRIAGNKPAVTVLQGLVPLFGMRAEVAEPKAFINTLEAAKVYCEMRLNKWNADSRSARVEILTRPSLVWPNRPIEFLERSYVATTRKLTHSLVWNGGMSMTLDVNYIRGWDGRMHQPDEPNRRLYSPLGGFASRPLNYAITLSADAPTESVKTLAPGATQPTVGKKPKKHCVEISGGKRFAPLAPETIALFQRAIVYANSSDAGHRVARKKGEIPAEWADNHSLHEILSLESDGIVGIPNLTYKRSACDPSTWTSVHDDLRRGINTTGHSATGLGQLQLANVDAYYPTKRAGIGKELDEAAGMLLYIKDRYGTPERALERHLEDGIY